MSDAESRKAIADDSEMSDGLKAEVLYHREVDAEQSRHLGVFEVPALVLVGLVISPLIAYSVVSSHVRTKRAIRRARI